jgi:hypothetical protein
MYVCMTLSVNLWLFYDILCLFLPDYVFMYMLAANYDVHFS